MLLRQTKKICLGSAMAIQPVLDSLDGEVRWKCLGGIAESESELSEEVKIAE